MIGILRRDVLMGALCGSLAWIVYGAVELGLSCFLIRGFRSDIELQSWQWSLIAPLWGVYAIIGLLTGAAGAALLTRTGRPRFERNRQFAACLTLTLAFILNLAWVWPTLAISEICALVLALALGATLVAGLVSDAWHKRAGFLANSWAVSLLLLGGPWISRDALPERSVTVKTGVFLLLVSMIVIVALLWQRVRLRSIPVFHWQSAAVGTFLAALLVVSSMAQSLPGPDQPAVPGRPNVLLITMDTVRADHLSVYGYDRETTPNLQGLAREATLYRRAVAASDLTLPSHATIFTGLYPSWHGADFAPPDYPNGRPLASGVKTLAEVLESNGYWTGAVVANHGYLHPAFGLNRGFDSYDYRRPAELLARNRPFYLRAAALKAVRLVYDISSLAPPTLRAVDINRHTFRLLQSGRGRPFFLFLNYMDAHMPYAPPPPFDTRFPGKDPHFRPAADRDLEDEVVNAVVSGKRALTPAEHAHFVSQYDGGIAYIDSQIGALLARLRELDLYENTLIVITADHGEAFGEHGLLEHGNGFVYQDQVHVPLLIKYPRRREGRQSDALASHVDLMPTVLEVAGVAAPPGLQGRTLSQPRVGDSDAVYSEARAPVSLASVNPRLRGIRRAVFAGSSKLIVWTAGPTEFYDLASDTEESHDRYQPDDPRMRELADRLTKWTADIPRQRETPRKLDKDAVERLKSLGYVQ
jgi:arylsulfatase A-like enzyme